MRLFVFAICGYRNLKLASTRSLILLDEKPSIPSITKSKIRYSKYHCTLALADGEKAEKLKQSLHPGKTSLRVYSVDQSWSDGSDWGRMVRAPRRSVL
ncbi:hypothetical protein BT69DRAFT_868809 [Atractiella rhizophila]|nr:hypothetical protein BT69DRAFT_868809 [Atractiella rhizophila]